MTRAHPQVEKPSRARMGSVRVHRPGSGRMVEEVIVNKNVSWLDSPAVWVCYLCGKCRRVSGQVQQLPLTGHTFRLRQSTRSSSSPWLNMNRI